jgi:hypothetical protein
MHTSHKALTAIVAKLRLGWAAAQTCWLGKARVAQ